MFESFISLLIILLSAGFFVFAGYFIFSIFRKIFISDSNLYPPFVRVTDKAISEIIKALGLREGDVVYDLGCGDATVLLSCAKVSPEIKCIGLDIDRWVVALARVRVWLSGAGDRVEIRHGDFYKSDVTSATKVFLFLFPEAMDKLLPKLRRELKPGTLVVSAAFTFSDKQPEQVIDLPVGGRQITKKLYLYRF